MEDYESLRQIVEDLIEVMHTHARETVKLVEHVQQVAGRLGDRHGFAVVASELSELSNRVKKLKPGGSDGHTS
jgi:hypothetical protein